MLRLIYHSTIAFISLFVATHCWAEVSDSEDTQTVSKVLMLGDEVMLAYKSDLLELVGEKADLSFVTMPMQANPDWNAFCEASVYGRGYDVIHFSYGRELMVHDDGQPRVSNAETWTVYSRLIAALKKSDAFLVGCTTTPIRGSVEQYDSGVDWVYTTRFRQLLGPNGIKINDLWDYTRTRLNEMVQANSFLPSKIGSQLMAEQVANHLFEAIDEGIDPDRPRILIVGDSIVGGFYGPTRDLFAGEAIVYSGGTTYEDPDPDWKRIVDEYITKGGDRGWDVIQFNWGLHAMKHVDMNNKALDADQPGARVQFPPADYIRELETFVQELKRTGAELVFATTTPIPEGSTGAIVHLDQSAYNVPAIELMKRHEIIVNDLYGFALPRLEAIQHPNNVHFTAEGSEELANANYAVLSALITPSSN
ncbi:SGNH/GDSL hydrolase family protein [Coraliomargarita akajimensis]|uniref:SGNH hydrolase-type esterase domain-containing protein n=1 Tax=Coraliomargarita akajimensis (strain DSM 45221 / IAM 15411 / JCM 23193 / KCTC 12865 / 04OKA010-24) TaxID=583355 RepID=D5EQQ6_CORAD|nr:SGNH/GDSL hydrolase family protein [Coraliomargarita akajimensis]ADE55870.1 hypothetical protein Caka_2857 [Coraliomargarita akajimensis DSM 45221]